MGHNSKEGKIKKYWEDPGTVSLVDKNLRHLEEAFVLSYLKKCSYFADFGCGGGSSTAIYARRVRRCLALEQSKHLYNEAVGRFKRSNLLNIDAIHGSVTALPKFERPFDVILTQRVLINLPDWNAQKKAITDIYMNLKPGGRYLMIENTFEGHKALNAARNRMGLKDIPIHWHNLFFKHELLVDFLKSLFILEEHHTFDLYYLLTRVHANLFLTFEGFGKNVKKDPLCDAYDEASAKLYELMGRPLRIDKRYSFGPIQGFALRKPVR